MNANEDMLAGNANASYSDAAPDAFHIKTGHADGDADLCTSELCPAVKCVYQIMLYR